LIVWSSTQRSRALRVLRMRFAHPRHPRRRPKDRLVIGEAEGVVALFVRRSASRATLTTQVVKLQPE